MTDAQRWVKEIFGGSITAERRREFERWFEDREHRAQYVQILDLRPKTLH